MDSIAKYFGGTRNEAPVLQIERPVGIPEQNWSAIQGHLDRLNIAIAGRDIPLVIGSAKELVESIAKVVCELRGKTLSNRADFSECVNAAHEELDRQPGKGLAIDRTIRDAAQAAKKIVCTIPETRNLYGTGHGRSFKPEVVDEVALVTIDSALLWGRWALRRLRYVIIGRPETLVNQLDNEHFRSGLLTEQLELANLGSLSPSDQRLIGLHVAWRALTGTFLVMEEGVEACVRSPDLKRWPEGYREGLLNGLLIAKSGAIFTNTWAVKQLALLFQSTKGKLDFESIFVLDAVKTASYAPYFSERQETLKTLRELRSGVPSEAHRNWDKIIDRFEIPF